MGSYVFKLNDTDGDDDDDAAAAAAAADDDDDENFVEVWVGRHV